MFSKEAGDGVDIGCGTNRLATCVHYCDNTLFPTSVFHLLQLYNKDSKLVDEDLSVCQGSVWFVTSKWRVPESMNVERVYSDFCSSLCKDTLPCIQSWPSDAFRHRLGIVFTFFFFLWKRRKSWLLGCLKVAQAGVDGWAWRELRRSGAAFTLYLPVPPSRSVPFPCSSSLLSRGTHSLLPRLVPCFWGLSYTPPPPRGLWELQGLSWHIWPLSFWCLMQWLIGNGRRMLISPSSTLAPIPLLSRTLKFSLRSALS